MKMRKQNLSEKQLNKNLNQPPVSTGENEADELPINLADFKPEIQKKIMWFLRNQNTSRAELGHFSTVRLNQARNKRPVNVAESRSFKNLPP
jgi:hypothetical protein